MTMSAKIEIAHPAKTPQAAAAAGIAFAVLFALGVTFSSGNGCLDDFQCGDQIIHVRCLDSVLALDDFQSLCAVFQCQCDLAVCGCKPPWLYAA